MGARHVAYFVSFVAIAISVWAWFSRGDDKYGIDFRGGHEFVVKIDAEVDTEKLQEQLEKKGFDGVSVQPFEKASRDYVIRFADDADSKVVREKMRTSLGEVFSEKAQILRTDSVGPTIGAELRRDAIIAVVLGLLMTVVYIAWKFEGSFAIGALVSLAHDVIVATGGYLLCGFTLNGAALAAALTIVGYSVNDTIVIFDRVREEMGKSKDANLEELLNDALNFCLSRTIITSALTLISVAALYVFGGGAIADLSFFLLIGLISGVYSTVFIAAPIVLAFENFRVAHARRKLARA